MNESGTTPELVMEPTENPEVAERGQDGDSLGKSREILERAQANIQARRLTQETPTSPEQPQGIERAEQLKELIRAAKNKAEAQGYFEEFTNILKTWSGQENIDVTTRIRIGALQKTEPQLQEIVNKLSSETAAEQPAQQPPEWQEFQRRLNNGTADSSTSQTPKTDPTEDAYFEAKAQLAQLDSEQKNEQASSLNEINTLSGQELYSKLKEIRGIGHNLATYISVQILELRDAGISFETAADLRQMVYVGKVRANSISEAFGMSPIVSENPPDSPEVTMRDDQMLEAAATAFTPDAGEEPTSTENSNLTGAQTTTDVVSSDTMEPAAATEQPESAVTAELPSIVSENESKKNGERRSVLLGRIRQSSSAGESFLPTIVPSKDTASNEAPHPPKQESPDAVADNASSDQVIDLAPSQYTLQPGEPDGSNQSDEPAPEKDSSSVPEQEGSAVDLLTPAEQQTFAQIPEEQKKDYVKAFGALAKSTLSKARKSIIAHVLFTALTIGVGVGGASVVNINREVVPQVSASILEGHIASQAVDISPASPSPQVIERINNLDILSPQLDQQQLPPVEDVQPVIESAVPQDRIMESAPQVQNSREAAQRKWWQFWKSSSKPVQTESAESTQSAPQTAVDVLPVPPLTVEPRLSPQPAQPEEAATTVLEDNLWNDIKTFFQEEGKSVDNSTVNGIKNWIRALNTVAGKPNIDFDTVSTENPMVVIPENANITDESFTFQVPEGMAGLTMTDDEMRRAYELLTSPDDGSEAQQILKQLASTELSSEAVTKQQALTVLRALRNR